MRKILIALATFALLSLSQQAKLNKKMQMEKAKKWVAGTDGLVTGRVWGQNQNQNIIIDDKGKNGGVIVEGTNRVFSNDGLIFAGQNQNQNQNIIIDDKGKNDGVVVAGTDGVFLDDKNGKVTSDFVFAGQNQNQNGKVDIVTNTFPNRVFTNTIRAPLIDTFHNRVLTNTIRAPLIDRFPDRVFTHRPRRVFHNTVFTDHKGKDGVTLV
jgi:hypothetical protein